jgi:hypothetical protein
MNSRKLILASGAAAALLTACSFSSSSDPVSVSHYAVPQAAGVRHQTSSQQTLIYTSHYDDTSGVIYAYPGGTQQTYEIDPATGPEGLCSDSKGDVFLVGRSGEVEEYSFGATSPTAAVSIAQEIADDGCAVDGTAEHIAMITRTKRNTQVAVLTNFTPPVKSYSPTITPVSLTYDNKGNLFVLPIGKFLIEIKKGSRTFTTIPYGNSLSFSDASFIQWDGQYLAIIAVHGGRKEGFSHWIYRCKIAASAVQLVSIVKPLSFLDPRGAGRVRSWIQSDRNIFVSGQVSTGLSIWAYPDAGKKLAHFAGNFTDAVVAAP